MAPKNGGDKGNRNLKPSACKADALPLELYPHLVPALGIEPSSEVFLGLPALGFLSFKDTYYFTSRWFLMLPITETKPLHRHVCFAGITSKYTISTYKSISKMVDRARIELAIESYQDPVIHLTIGQ